MKKHIKNSILKTLTAAFLLVLFTATTALAQTDNDTEALISDYIEQWFYDSFSEHYVIDDYQSVISDMQVNGSDISAKIAIMAMTTLDYDSVEDVPYMRGLKNALNISAFAEIVPAAYVNSLSSAATSELTKSVAIMQSQKYESAINRLEVSKVSGVSTLSYNSAINNILSSLPKNISRVQATNLVQMVADKFVDVAECIDRSTVLSMDLTFSAKLNNGQLVDIEMNHIYDDELIPVDDTLIENANTMVAAAAQDLTSFLESTAANTLSMNIGTSIVPMGYSSYNRIAARNYAWQYTAPGYGYNTGSYPTYGDGYSAAGGIDTSYWNLAKYKCTTETDHASNEVDCACFVSQCLHAGGIPITTTWKFSTLAWCSVPHLIDYMTSTKSYMDIGTRATCNAGNVIKTSSSHVVLCTYNDTVTGRYTGHTNDRNNKYYPISGSGWTFYNINTN